MTLKERKKKQKQTQGDSYITNLPLFCHTKFISCCFALFKIDGQDPKDSQTPLKWSDPQSLLTLTPYLVMRALVANPVYFHQT